MPSRRVPLTTLDPPGGWVNAPVHVHDLRGSPVLLHFWSKDCDACKDDLPQLRRWVDTFAPRGLKVVGVHTPLERGEALDTNALERLCRELELRHPVGADDGALSRAYGVAAVPAYLVFDGDGQLLHHVSGARAVGHVEHVLERLTEAAAPDAAASP